MFYARNRLQHTSTHEACNPLNDLTSGVARRLVHLGTGVSWRRDICHLVSGTRHQSFRRGRSWRKVARKYCQNASDSPPHLVLPSPIFSVAFKTSHSNVAFEHHIFSHRSRHSSIISFGSVGTIGLNALPEDTTPAPASTTVQRSQRRFASKRIEVFGLPYLERAPRCYNILGKICLPFICSYCGKYVQVFPQ